MASVVMKEFEHLKIHLEELKTATDSFSSKVIGFGGFGKVYEGEVSHSRGRSIVAIKRLNREFGQGDPEFLKEVVMLSRYRHKNLISLLGFCDEDGEKILVYEHASNGSLDRHLSSNVHTWTKRLKICLDVARGLAHLHDHKGTQQRVLHRDVKSANILLDDNWNAKLADMGLSKLGPANQQHTVLFTNVVGTPGYCDPQYMVTYALTKESDIYSFGVVLFEVLCGRLCSKWTNNCLEILVSMWKQSYKHKKLDEIIFKDLMLTMDPTSLRIFSDIAFQCLHDSREQRPSISLLVKRLETALQFQEHHEMKLDGVMGTSRTYLKGHFLEGNELFLGKKQKEGAIQNNESDVYDDVDNFSHPELAYASFSPSPEQDYNESDDFDDVDINKPLPTVESLQITGDPFPGNQIQVNGYSINGTTQCTFEWVRFLHDKSMIYIEGAKDPTYTVTADDLDNYLAVDVQPLDDRQRKGEVVRCFVNDNKRITCHPYMLREIVRSVSVGRVHFKVFVLNASRDTREPGILDVMKSGYSIKVNGSNNSVVVVKDKYAPTTNVNLAAEDLLQFSIVGPKGVKQYLCADCNETGIWCTRDAIVLTMRLFIKRAVDKKLGGKKRRCLFF